MFWKAAQSLERRRLLSEAELLGDARGRRMAWRERDWRDEWRTIKFSKAV